MEANRCQDPIEPQRRRMPLPMTSNVAPMSAATPIQRVARPRVARTRNTALVAREKRWLVDG